MKAALQTTHYHDYEYSNADAPWSMYLIKKIDAFFGDLKPGTRVLDVGCGNGFLAGHLLTKGCTVIGIELSTTGVEVARSNHPGGRFEVLAADDKILENLGERPFDIAISAEVVEHLYSPASFAKGCFTALRPGGRFICTTPYHGYFKNLLIASFNRVDQHFNPLWEGGHIKFWSRRTLSRLLTETGFINVQFVGAGRVPLLWKSMVLAADKPLIV